MLLLKTLKNEGVLIITIQLLKTLQTKYTDT